MTTPRTRLKKVHKVHERRAQGMLDNLFVSDFFEKFGEFSILGADLEKAEKK
jgi:hypothetical protein